MIWGIVGVCIGLCFAAGIIASILSHIAKALNDIAAELRKMNGAPL